jgi:hypothetical protein
MLVEIVKKEIGDLSEEVEPLLGGALLCEVLQIGIHGIRACRGTTPI